MPGSSTGMTFSDRALLHHAAERAVGDCQHRELDLADLAALQEMDDLEYVRRMKHFK